MKPDRNPGGRPRIGERIIVTLSPEQRATALRLGHGVIAAGVRAALDRADSAPQGATCDGGCDRVSCVSGGKDAV